MTKRPFIAKGYRTKECLKLVYTDVREPFNVHAQKGYEYFTFIDDYYRFGYIYLMHRKYIPWINSLNLR